MKVGILDLDYYFNKLCPNRTDQEFNLLYDNIKKLPNYECKNIPKSDKANFKRSCRGERRFPDDKALYIKDVFFSTLDQSDIDHITLREIALANSYELTKKTSKIKVDDKQSLIDQFDEYDKQLLDYVLEFNSYECLKYLLDTIKERRNIVKENRLIKMIVEGNMIDYLPKLYDVNNYLKDGLNDLSNITINNKSAIDYIIENSLNKIEFSKTYEIMNTYYSSVATNHKIIVIDPINIEIFKRLITKYSDKEDAISNAVQQAIKANQFCFNRIIETIKDYDYRIDLATGNILISDFILCSFYAIDKSLIDNEYKGPRSEILKLFKRNEKFVRETYNIKKFQDNKTSIGNLLLLDHQKENKLYYQFFKDVDNLAVKVPKLYKNDGENNDEFKIKINDSEAIRYTHLSSIDDVMQIIKELVKIKSIKHDGKCYSYNNFEDGVILFKRSQLVAIHDWRKVSLDDGLNDYVYLIANHLRLDDSTLDYKELKNNLNLVLNEIYENDEDKDNLIIRTIDYVNRQLKSIDKEQYDYLNRVKKLMNTKSILEAYLAKYL